MRKLVGLTFLVVMGLLTTGDADAVQKQSCTKSALCTGLIAVFDFEEASDSAREASNSYARLFEPDGYNVGTAAGKLGTNAVSFTGATGSNLVGLNSGLFGMGTWSTAFWVYPTSAGTSGNWYVILTKDYTNDRSTFIGVKNTSGVLYAYIHGYHFPGTSTALTSTLTVPLSAWTHLAFGVANWANGTSYLWIQKNAGTRTTLNLPSYIVGNGWDLLINAGTTGLPGRLDQLVISQKAWTPAEVSLLYNSGSGRAYPFDTGN